MAHLYYILSHLEEDDVDWLSTAGVARRLAVGEVLIEEQSRVEALYLIIDGQLMASAPSQGL
ncbi:MAG TPA: hypothetical protein VGE07_02165, partial [Herpetosiphonaceae bacterium]